MNWILWLCMTSATGGSCVTEERWITESRAACFEQKSAFVIAPNSTTAVTVGEATSVEVQPPAQGRVVIGCVQEPKAVVAAASGAAK